MDFHSLINESDQKLAVAWKFCANDDCGKSLNTG